MESSCEQCQAAALADTKDRNFIGIDRGELQGDIDGSNRIDRNGLVIRMLFIGQAQMETQPLAEPAASGIWLPVSPP